MDTETDMEENGQEKENRTDIKEDVKGKEIKIDSMEVDGEDNTKNRDNLEEEGNQDCGPSTGCQ